MENLDKIVGYFEPGKTPTYEEFKKSWTSFFHKSEKFPQTQVLGLNDSLNQLEQDKASKEDLANVTVGLVPMGNVANIAELNTKPKRNNDSYFVLDQLNESGDPYIFRYDAELGEWINTKQVVCKNVAKNPLYFVSTIKYGIASDINNGITSANVNYDNVQLPVSEEYIISNCVPKHILFYSGVPSSSTFISYVDGVKDNNGAYTFTKPDNCTYIAINFSKTENPNGYTNVSLSGGKRALEDTDRKFLLNLINKYNMAGSYLAQKIKLNTAVNHNTGSYPDASPNYDNLVIEAGKYIGIKGCIPYSACYYNGEPKESNTLYCRSKFTQDKLGIYVLENPANATHISINFSKANNPNGYDNGLLVTGDDATTYQEISKLIESLPNPPNIPKQQIVGIGDSLMQGFNDMSMLRFLQQYVGDAYNVVNNGVGGENISQIGGRVGVFPMYFEDSFLLPKDKTPVRISEWGNSKFRSSFNGDSTTPILQGNGGLNPVYIYGQKCTIKFVGSIANPVGSYWSIERVEESKEDIKIPAKSLIISNAERENRSPKVAIYAMGTNLGWSDIDDLVDKHKRFNDFMQTPNFIIIGIHFVGRLNLDDEKRMLKEFGNRYLNIREYLATDAMKDVGLTPTQEDLDRMAQGLCPYSLQRSKTDQHMSLKGSEAWAIAVYNRILQLNYI